MACEREPEIEVREVERPVAWRPVGNLRGIHRVLMSGGTDGERLLLQSPGGISVLEHSGANGTTTALGRFPTDPQHRLPIGPTYFAYPASDTLLAVVLAAHPLFTPAYLHLRTFDPSATSLTSRPDGGSLRVAFTLGGQALVPYFTQPGAAPTLALLTISTLSGTQPTLQAVKVTLPVAAGSVSYSDVRSVTAIDDFFLVTTYSQGIFKVTNTGAVRAVAAEQGILSMCRWKNDLYAFAEWSTALRSTDKGETWQRYTGIPDDLVLANYHSVGDSLLFSRFDRLFTLRWDAAGASYSIRALNSDGLDRTAINGVVLLRDTVYAVTTGGLFARPLREAFQSAR